MSEGAPPTRENGGETPPRQPARTPAFLLLFLLASCRTSAPSGVPIAPLAAATSEEAMQELRARRASFSGAQAVMHVRATVDGRTQSFQAKLSILDARRMELIAYTPLGTTAMKMSADGDHVSIDNRIEGTKSEGSFGFFKTSLVPAEMAMLILGLPPRDGIELDAAPAGLRSARVDDVSITYDPPAFPAKHAIVTRGDDRIEIQLREVVH